MNTLNNLPEDWENPNWEKCCKAHEWKNYASIPIREEWENFSLHQKKILAICFKDEAEKEEWD